MNNNFKYFFLVTEPKGRDRGDRGDSDRGRN